MQQLRKSKDVIKERKEPETKDETFSDKYLAFINTVQNRLQDHLKEDKENNYNQLRKLILKMGFQTKDEALTTPNNTPTGAETSSLGAVSELILTKNQMDYLRGSIFFLIIYFK